MSPKKEGAASPSLCGMLAKDGERNTLLSKRFAGGSLEIVAARAPRNQRRHTARLRKCMHARTQISHRSGAECPQDQGHEVNASRAKLPKPITKTTLKILILNDNGGRGVLSTPLKILIFTWC